MIFRDLHQFGRAGFLEERMTGVVIGVNMAPDLDDAFFAVIELVALVLILRLAWKWTEHPA